jgi:hypothetical protein
VDEHQFDVIRATGRKCPIRQPAVAVEVERVPVRIRRERIFPLAEGEGIAGYPVAEGNERKGGGRTYPEIGVRVAGIGTKVASTMAPPTRLTRTARSPLSIAMIVLIPPLPPRAR